MSHLDRAIIRHKKAITKFGVNHPNTINERLRIIELRTKKNNK